MVYAILMVLGGVCLAVWIAMLFWKSRPTLHEEVRVMALLSDRTPLPDELNPAELSRNLNFYSGNSSALQKYVGSLRERFEISIGIKVLEQNIRETGVKKELLVQVLDLLRTEGELRRLPQEEALKGQKLQTLSLEEQAKQGQLKGSIQHQQKIQGLETELREEELKQKIAALKKEPPEPPKPPKQPSRVQREKQRLKEEQELGRLRMKHQQEQLADYRRETYPHAWEDEIAWKKNLRANEPTEAESIISSYDQFKLVFLQKVDLPFRSYAASAISLSFCSWRKRSGKWTQASEPAS